VNAKQGAALALVVLVVVVGLAASAFLWAPSANVTYTVPTSAIRASLGETVSDETIALRLNSISDASKPATASTWIEFNTESHAAFDLYNFSLTPPPASRYLVANVTARTCTTRKFPLTTEISC